MEEKIYTILAQARPWFGSYTNWARLSSPRLGLARARLAFASLALEPLASVMPDLALFGLARLGSGSALPRNCMGLSGTFILY